MVLVDQLLAALSQPLLFMPDNPNFLLQFTSLSKGKAFSRTAFFLLLLLLRLLVDSFDEAMLLEVSALEERVVEDLKGLIGSQLVEVVEIELSEEGRVVVVPEVFGEDMEAKGERMPDEEGRVSMPPGNEMVVGCVLQHFVQFSNERRGLHVASSTDPHYGSVQSNIIKRVQLYYQTHSRITTIRLSLANDQDHTVSQIITEAILQQMEDNQSQSYDQSRIQSLRREVEVTRPELIKLAYDEERLQEKIDGLNRRGCDCIAQQQFYQAIVFLNEAESVLEYAAGCGRTIDRTLIIATLHNQACVYQRIWELNKSSDYLQAIIYNISSFLNSEAAAPFTPEIVSSLSPQHHKLAAYLSSKLQLISYNLQFCAVSSQIKNHDNALKAAQKSLNWLKGYCEELHSYEKLLGIKNSSELEKNLLLELQSIRNFQNEDSREMEKNIEKLMYKARKSISSFQKKAEGVHVGLGKEEQTELENFSLGQVMQVNPISVQRLQEKLNLNEELSLLRKIYKAIFMSIAHFTMATELRLIANQKHGLQSTYRKMSKQFKQSEIHHLVAVITVALYVPCYTKYFQHILNSFKNHYQIDLTQMSELSHNDSNAFGDDLIHLQIQSISARDSELNGHKDMNKMSKNTRVSDKMGVSFQKEGHKTVQDANHTGSPENSENQYLKQLNRTARSTERKYMKRRPQRSNKKLGEVTSREKQTLIIDKMTSRSKSKGKQLDSKRSKSRKSVHQVQQKQRVVHYFHYDNYSKKVVKKKMKVAKDVGEYEITKKPLKPLRDKKSPQVLINQHLKKLNQLSLSTKDLIANQLPKMAKKGKSPQLSTSRSHKHLLKKAS